MSLENLVKIGQLKAHPVDGREIEQLLVAARRNLADARVTSISAETRFDAAYKAIMQSSLAALMMHGYRPDTKALGHHTSTAEHCIREAEHVIDRVVAWRAANRSDLIP